MIGFLRPLLAVLIILATLPARADDAISRFVGVEGFLVHYTVSGKADGAPVILVHGLTLDGTFWANQAAALAATHKVVVVDLPGHGQSGRPTDIDYTLDLYAKAVEGTARDAGLSHAALIGHSLGLPVIHTVIRRGALKVDKAVFIDGAILAPAEDAKARAGKDKAMAELRQGLKGPSYQLVLEGFFRKLSPKLPADQAKRVMTAVRDADQHVTASTFDHLTDPKMWTPQRSQVPVLALYARMSETGVKGWLNANYPRNTLKVWDDVDHFPQLEQPDRVNKAILDFLG